MRFRYVPVRPMGQSMTLAAYKNKKKVSSPYRYINNKSKRYQGFS